MAAAPPALAAPVDEITLLSTWTWIVLFLYSLAGWVMAHLRNAVAFASGNAETKASIISDLVASFASGMAIGVFVMLEYVLDPGAKVSPVAAYFGAAVGAYGGKKILDALVEGLQTAARNIFTKGSSK